MSEGRVIPVARYCSICDCELNHEEEAYQVGSQYICKTVSDDCLDEYRDKHFDMKKAKEYISKHYPEKVKEVESEYGKRLNDFTEIEFRQLDWRELFDEAMGIEECRVNVMEDIGE